MRKTLAEIGPNRALAVSLVAALVAMASSWLATAVGSLVGVVLVVVALISVAVVGASFGMWSAKRGSEAPDAGRD